MSPDVVQKLVDLDMPADTFRKVLKILADEMAAEESRRLRDRDRKRASRGQSKGSPRTVQGKSADSHEDGPPQERNQPPGNPPVEDEGREQRDRRVESGCRKILADSGIPFPVLADPNFVSLLVIYDTNEAWIEEDFYAAARAIVSTKHPIRYWNKLDSWITRAAADRMAAAMPTANYARAGPSASRKPESNRPEGRPNGTAKSPSDFLRSVMQSRADERESDNKKLLNG